jgi:BolA protein
MVVRPITSNPLESDIMTLGPVGQTISAKLAQAFAPQALEVIDESHQHAGHSGARPDGESHFRVKIVAEAFRAKSRVDQHRMVNAVLAEELKERVHALAIQASAPAAEPAAADLAFVTLKPDDPRLVAHLKAAGLAVSDLGSPGQVFTAIALGDGTILACGGLEVKGAAALIRSIAVGEAQRKSGLGTAMTFKLLADARNAGAAAAYLLTTQSAEFFARLGFTAIDRAKVPAPIAATSQFSGTACASAQAMVHVLRK